MRLRGPHDFIIIIISDHHFIDRLIKNLGVVGHHRPMVHTCVFSVVIIYLVIKGVGLTVIVCGSRETLIYRLGRLKPAVGFQLSKALPGLGALTSTLMKCTPCLSTKRIL